MLKKLSEDTITLLAIIDRVEEILRKGWCKGESAKDSNGSPVGPTDERAISFCLGGAMEKAQAEFNMKDCNAFGTDSPLSKLTQFRIEFTQVNDHAKTVETPIALLHDFRDHILNQK